MQYPWHPAYGNTIVVHYREKRGDRDVFVCTIAGDSGLVIPIWMFDRAICLQMTLGERRASMAALQELRGVLSELQAVVTSSASGTVASEEADDPDAPQNAATLITTSAPDEARVRRRKKNITPEVRAEAILLLSRLLLQVASVSQSVREVCDEHS